MPAFREGAGLISAVAAVLARDDIDQLIVVDASDDPVSYTHLTLPTIYSV